MSKPIRTPAKGRKLRLGREPARRPFFPITSVWQEEIRRRLIARSWSQAELARRIGASPAAIVLIFKGTTIQSRLVPEIHRVLELDPPSMTVAVEAA